ncbi:MAG: metal-dependent hydrolase [Algibacter sp.]|uniref:metal-dependent hydrolase n=1 Tax=Algibacter sp. TaxID=1872428 RepID=UPI00260EA975|nr:metal-dependent hydrolase [Algibacter sp.]MDG1730931.1 metal-dependent hydrolase [Algibacter sp.]MDG2179064.1 metal-dependent hydrolase [Algibacter sp.]
MDSLTQIVLGAACGEAVLGKKIGNKALLFGAIGGTIPDLDVLVGGWLYGNEIDAMLFHRGFMHSIVFTILAAFLLGWLIHKGYNSGKRLQTTTQSDWISLFFWALFTHPILDCFTPYGTQLFAPFSNYRVALNNIAVADPAYTLPFLICIVVLMFFNRTSDKRRLWLKLGIGISSMYMLFTLGNKLYIDDVFRKSLNDSKISALRFSTQPAIFNTILWYGIVETDASYFVSDYSLLDSENRFLNFRKIPKQRDLKPSEFKDIKDLAWFSNQYYSVYKRNENEYQYNDLRYPLLDLNNPNSSVFTLLLYKDENRLNMKPFEPKFDSLGNIMASLWERIKGI